MIDLKLIINDAPEERPWKEQEKKLNPKNSRWEERIKIRNDINKIKIKSHTKN